MSEQGLVRTPHPALQPYVGTYVGYHLHLDPRAVHHGLPSTRTTLIVAFDKPLDVGWAARPDQSDSYWVMAAGLHPMPALVHTHGVQHGLQLDLTPAGVRALLGLPMGELGGLVVGSDVLPTGIDESTYDMLAAAGSWQERFDLLERRLLELLPDEPPTADRPEVTHAWQLIDASGGRLSIDRIAREVGWSRRTLAGRFVAEFGVGPKQAARIRRFEQARRLLESGRQISDVAVECGFADQAHLNRDWSTLAGRSPLTTLREPFSIPNVQDAPASRRPHSSP